jgi:recombination endonuclease VII
MLDPPFSGLPLNCKDCGKPANSVKACKHKVCPGPRCLACWRIEKKRRSKVAHGRRIEALYGITESEYTALYEAQGRKCAICQRASGARKRLAVDHDHKTGEVRGLLCGWCNFEIIGKSNEDPTFFQRAIDYLRSPPARKVLSGKTD